MAKGVQRSSNSCPMPSQPAGVAARAAGRAYISSSGTSTSTQVQAQGRAGSEAWPLRSKDSVRSDADLLAAAADPGTTRVDSELTMPGGVAPRDGTSGGTFTPSGGANDGGAVTTPAARLLLLLHLPPATQEGTIASSGPASEVPSRDHHSGAGSAVTLNGRLLNHRETDGLWNSAGSAVLCSASNSGAGVASDNGCGGSVRGAEHATGRAGHTPSSEEDANGVRAPLSLNVYIHHSQPGSATPTAAAVATVESPLLPPSARLISDLMPPLATASSLADDDRPTPLPLLPRLHSKVPGTHGPIVVASAASSTSAADAAPAAEAPTPLYGDQGCSLKRRHAEQHYGLDVLASRIQSLGTAGEDCGMKRLRSLGDGGASGELAPATDGGSSAGSGKRTLASAWPQVVLTPVMIPRAPQRRFGGGSETAAMDVAYVCRFAPPQSAPPSFDSANGGEPAAPSPGSAVEEDEAAAVEPLAWPPTIHRFGQASLTGSASCGDTGNGQRGSAGSHDKQQQGQGQQQHHHMHPLHPLRLHHVSRCEITSFSEQQQQQQQQQQQHVAHPVSGAGSRTSSREPRPSVASASSSRRSGRLSPSPCASHGVHSLAAAGFPTTAEFSVMGTSTTIAASLFDNPSQQAMETAGSLELRCASEAAQRSAMGCLATRLPLGRTLRKFASSSSFGGRGYSSDSAGQAWSDGQVPQLMLGGMATSIYAPKQHRPRQHQHQKHVDGASPLPPRLPLMLSITPQRAALARDGSLDPMMLQALPWSTHNVFLGAPPGAGSRAVGGGGVRLRASSSKAVLPELPPSGGHLVAPGAARAGDSVQQAPGWLHAATAGRIPRHSCPSGSGA